jgi:hypothetical protein
MGKDFAPTNNNEGKVIKKNSIMERYKDTIPDSVRLAQTIQLILAFIRNAKNLLNAKDPAIISRDLQSLIEAMNDAYEKKLLREEIDTQDTLHNQLLFLQFNQKRKEEIVKEILKQANTSISCLQRLLPFTKVVVLDAKDFSSCTTLDSLLEATSSLRKKNVLLIVPDGAIPINVPSMCKENLLIIDHHPEASKQKSDYKIERTDTPNAFAQFYLMCMFGRCIVDIYLDPQQPNFSLINIISTYLVSAGEEIYKNESKQIKIAEQEESYSRLSKNKKNHTTVVQYRPSKLIDSQPTKKTITKNDIKPSGLKIANKRESISVFYSSEDVPPGSIIVLTGHPDSDESLFAPFLRHMHLLESFNDWMTLLEVVLALSDRDMSNGMFSRPEMRPIFGQYCSDTTKEIARCFSLLAMYLTQNYSLDKKRWFDIMDKVWEGIIKLKTNEDRLNYLKNHPIKFYQERNYEYVAFCTMTKPFSQIIDPATNSEYIWRNPSTGADIIALNKERGVNLLARVNMTIVIDESVDTPQFLVEQKDCNLKIKVRQIAVDVAYKHSEIRVYVPVMSYISLVDPNIFKDIFSQIGIDVGYTMGQSKNEEYKTRVANKMIQYALSHNCNLFNMPVKNSIEQLFFSQYIHEIADIFQSHGFSSEIPNNNHNNNIE